MWILGSKSTVFSGKVWADAALHLDSVADAMPRHHVKHLTKLSSMGPAKEDDDQAVTDWQKEEECHRCYAAAVRKAIAAGRIDPKALKQKALDKRTSRQLKGASAWQAANVDVYDLILDRCSVQMFCASKMADISQNAGRGQVVTCGVVGTLTTSTRLFCYETSMILPAEQHLAILGWERDVSLHRLCPSEVFEMAGNRWLFPTLHQESRSEGNLKLQLSTRYLRLAEFCVARSLRRPDKSCA